MTKQKNAHDVWGQQKTSISKTCKITNFFTVEFFGPISCSLILRARAANAHCQHIQCAFIMCNMGLSINDVILLGVGDVGYME